jgi:transcriptional regulator with XRE-family HTH domain
VSSTLAALLGPYNRSEVARKVGTTRGRVNRWANDQGAPDVHELPALSKILRIDVAELTAIIAADNARRSAQVARAS